MPRTLIKLDRILTMDPSRRVIVHGGIVIDGDRIEQILTAEQLGRLSGFAGSVVDASRFTAIPGFVQTHVHLCQTLLRGMADDLELIDWLQLRIFPGEAAHTARSMYTSTWLGIAELLRSGTTTIMDMGSVAHEEEIVRAVEESGIRACLGKALMDLNDMYRPLRESTDDALTSALHQAEQWHQSAEGRIRYAVAPRFVLSCTDTLLKEAYAMTESFPGMLFHTHAAENRRELEQVRARCGMDNVEFLESIGALQQNSCLAHCIWLNDNEMALLARRRAHVLHCPSSNLKLGSGVARIPEMLQGGINVSLGADGAPCNNTLDMFHEMRLAALIQKPAHGPTAMPAQTVFELATLGGAAALGLGEEIGSLAPGRKADIVLLDLDKPWNPPDGRDPYSTIVYSGTPENVHSVMVNGAWVYREGKNLRVEEEELVRRGKKEGEELREKIH